MAFTISQSPAIRSLKRYGVYIHNTLLGCDAMPAIQNKWFYVKNENEIKKGALMYFYVPNFLTASSSLSAVCLLHRFYVAKVNRLD